MILLVQELPFPAVSGGVPIIFVVNEIIKVKVINISDECSRSKVIDKSDTSDRYLMKLVYQNERTNTKIP